MDTSSANFGRTPVYFISLSGPGGSMWQASGGASSIYNPTATGFDVYVLRNDGKRLTLQEVAKQYKWYVNWVGIGSYVN